MAGLGTKIKDAVMNSLVTTEEDMTVKMVYNVGDSSARTSVNHKKIDKSIVSTMKNRIALDAATTAIRHIRVDDNEFFLENVNSEFNYIMKTKPNMDQTAIMFMQDAVSTMLDKGHVVIAPMYFDTLNGNISDIYILRSGYATQWHRDSITLRVYDENRGVFVEEVISKSKVAIVENPFYDVMNEPNGTFSRLATKLAVLDSYEKAYSNGKIDVIMQLPHALRTEKQRDEAKERIQEFETQMKDSTYGITYTAANEKIHQLNRPIENTLLEQVEGLQKLAFSQMGMTEGILNGSAATPEMDAYYSRIVLPILSSMCQAMTYTFIDTASYNEGERIAYIKEPFKYMTTGEFSQLSGGFVQDRILASNEVRAQLGYKPDLDPNSDRLASPYIDPLADMEDEQEYTE